MPSTQSTVLVVGVRFKPAGKIYYFDPNGLELRPGDPVIVETARGLEFGHVVIRPRQVAEDEVLLPLRPVVRCATLEDLDQLEENRRLAREAYRICVERVRQHDLAMKIVAAEYTFDRGKLVLYFTADERVDFRTLVRELAATFRTRIELRQIGVRDEAKIIGGLGPCGRLLCCTTFLAEFEPISIRMAKDQSLSLSPSKLTGLCGRLKCCLRYENDTYVEARALLPREGARVHTPCGSGRVIGLDFLGRRVRIRLDDDRVVELPYTEVEEAS
ncbi:MAG TPA: stage 0 sporulation family protein [Bacillota bacterium]